MNYDKYVEEFEKKFNKPVSGDFVMRTNSPHVYADLTKHKDWLRTTLKAVAEEARREEREEILGKKSRSSTGEFYVKDTPL